MKKVTITVLASCLLFFASSSNAAVKNHSEYSDIIISTRIAECVAEIPPDVSRIHARALKYARISPDDLTKWKKNVKLAALLPRLQFGYERKLADGVAVAVDDKVSVTGAGSVVGPTTSAFDQSLDRNHNVEVNAVWYLDELVFNRDSLSVSSEARSLASARRSLLGEIDEDYFELKKLISFYMSKRPEVENLKGEIRLRIDYLVGKLDAVSGGWFGPVFKWKELGCE